MRARIVAFCTVAVLAVLLPKCSESQPGDDPARNQLDISLTITGPRYQGNYYRGYLPRTDYAMWIQTPDSQMVKTLAITRNVVTVGSYGAHENHLPVWKAVAGLSGVDSTLWPPADSLSYVLEPYDALTAASVNCNPDSSEHPLSSSWDFTDSTGRPVEPGTYWFCAEATNIAKDSVIGVPYAPATINNEATCGLCQIGSDTAITAAEPTEHIVSLGAALAR